MIVFSERVGDLNHEENALLRRNVKNWVINICDAQSHRHWYVSGKIHKLRIYDVFVARNFDVIVSSTTTIIRTLTKRTG